MLSPACSDVISPMYWMPSIVLKLSPTVQVLSPIVMNNLYNAEGIPTCTAVTPTVLKVSIHSIEYPPQYWCYPHSTEALPTVLSNLHSTEASPQYWCYPPDVLNNLHSTEPTLYGVNAAANWESRA